MFKDVRHFGIPTKNLQASKFFYLGLGFTVVLEATEDWGGEAIQTIKMIGPNKVMIELFDRFGSSPYHVALTVDSLPIGEETVSERPSGHKVKFITAPEGTRIELVEEP